MSCHHSQPGETTLYLVLINRLKELFKEFNVGMKAISSKNEMQLLASAANLENLAGLTIINDQEFCVSGKNAETTLNFTKIYENMTKYAEKIISNDSNFSDIRSVLSNKMSNNECMECESFIQGARNAAILYLNKFTGIPEAFKVV